MNKKINGFTLIEVMVTAGILIVLGGIFLIPFFLTTQKSLKMQNNKIYAEENARLAMGRIMSKVRSAETIVHNREIGTGTSKKNFDSGTSSLTLLALSTDTKGNIRKESNLLLGTKTNVWSVYEYTLEHKNTKFDDELIEYRYEVLNTNDENPFNGTWTALSLKEKVKFGSYMNGTATGLVFEYWDSGGKMCSNPEDAVYITIKVNTKVGSGTPYCQEAFLESDVFLRRKVENF